jgi:prevent-host-death family protein
MSSKTRIHLEEGNMQIMKAAEFKAKCLHLMDEINRTGEEITITKNGVPVSVLKAYRVVPETLFGLHQGKIQSKDDLIAPPEN